VSQTALVYIMLHPDFSLRVDDVASFTAGFCVVF